MRTVFCVVAMVLVSGCHGDMMSIRVLVIFAPVPLVDVVVAVIVINKTTHWPSGT